MLSQDELQSLKDAVGVKGSPPRGIAVPERRSVKVFSFFLHEFDTELDFSNKLRYDNSLEVSFSLAQRAAVGRMHSRKNA